MQVRQKYRPRKKKPEHVQGAWLYILGVAAVFFGCAITGRDPNDVLALGFLLPVTIGFLVLCVLIVGIIGGILGGNGK